MAKDEAFCFTYADGVGDVDISAAIDLHRNPGSLATVTATQPPGRFGILRTEGQKVVAFREKPEDGGWINGGYFVLSPKVADYIENDKTVWEREPLEKLAAEGQLSVSHHYGFWQPMDTLRDKRLLEDLWVAGKAPWQTWTRISSSSTARIGSRNSPRLALHREPAQGRGIAGIDDYAMPSVRILHGFLSEEDEWALKEIVARTAFFRRERKTAVLNDCQGQWLNQVPN